MCRGHIPAIDAKPLHLHLGGGLLRVWQTQRHAGFLVTKCVFMLLSKFYIVFDFVLRCISLAYFLSPVSGFKFTLLLLILGCTKLW